MKKLILWVPLAIFALFLVTVAFQLSQPKDDRIRSRMVGQPLPEFALEPAVPGRAGLSSTDLASGSPRVLNVFASWCVPCIAEAPLLLQLKNRGVAIDAIAKVRDQYFQMRRCDRVISQSFDQAANGCFIERLRIVGWLQRRPGARQADQVKGRQLLVLVGQEQHQIRARGVEERPVRLVERHRVAVVRVRGARGGPTADRVGGQQIHGAQGLQKGHLLEHLYRDVRAPRIYEGASEVQRSIIARELFKARELSQEGSAAS